MQTSGKFCSILIAMSMALPTYGQAERAPDQHDAAEGKSDVEAVTRPEERRAEPVPAQPTSRLIEEIVVTAQKREELAQDVPISVQAFSTDYLDARAIYDTQDLPKITPGLTVTTQVGFSTIFLRGIGTDVFLLADPSVSVYVDEVYVPFVLGIVQDFGAIERIEVLKGPQGTLFGRNSLGGAIRILSKTPSIEDFTGEFEATAAGSDTQRLRGYVSVPLGHTLAVSASGYYNGFDQTADGRYGPDHSRLPRGHTDGTRFKLLWAPADWFNLQLARLDSKIESFGSLYAPNTDPSLLARTLGATPQDPYAGEVNEVPDFGIKNRVSYGNAKLNLPWLDLKVFGSDQFIADHQATDFDGTPAPVAKFKGRAFNDSQTAELQLLSNEQTFLSDRLEWILGSYLFESNAGIRPADLTVAGLSPGIGTIRLTGTLDTSSLAFFSQFNINITEWLELGLGWRHQSEKRTLVSSTAGIVNLDGSVTNFNDFSGTTTTTRGFDPKVSVSLRPAWPWLGHEPLLYASYQTATKSATINVIKLNGPPEIVKPEKLTAYEVGIKTQLFDGVQLNAAAFQYKVEDPQVQIISVTSAGVVSFENAGSARTNGVDFDAVIPLFPALTNDGLVLALSGAWLDAIYTSYEDGTGFDPITGQTQGGMDFTGNRVVRTPKYSLTAGLLQTFHTPLGPLEVGADYYYNSGFSWVAQGTPRYSEHAYSVVGARTSYLYEPWNLRATLFGTNILNTRYNVGRFIQDFGSNDAVAPLATWGLRVSYEF